MMRSPSTCAKLVSLTSKMPSYQAQKNLTNSIQSVMIRESSKASTGFFCQPVRALMKVIGHRVRQWLRHVLAKAQGHR